MLKIDDTYTRLGDDNSGEITVAIARDADVWVDVFSNPDPEEASSSHRFRLGFGGGESEGVRNALLVLAVAIQHANTNHPQDHRRKIDKAAKKSE